MFDQSMTKYPAYDYRFIYIYIYIIDLNHDTLILSAQTLLTLMVVMAKDANAFND